MGSPQRLELMISTGIVLQTYEYGGVDGLHTLMLMSIRGAQLVTLT